MFEKTQLNLQGKWHEMSKWNNKQSHADLCCMMRTSDGDMEEFCCWCAEVSFQMESVYFSAWLLDFIILMRESAVYLISPLCNTLILDSGGGVPILPLLCLPLHVHSRLLFKHAFFGLQLGSTWGCTLSLKTIVGPLSPLLGFQMHAETSFFTLAPFFTRKIDWVILQKGSTCQRGSILQFLSFFSCLCVFA